MSFFGWFKSTPQPARGQAASPREAATGVRAPAETKDAAVRAKEAATNTAERRKNERSRLRELLYKVCLLYTSLMRGAARVMTLTAHRI